ncbi:glycosyltransferase family 8 protein [Elizabethkingia argentiflava]|uniref:Glycosyltransferase family 8 protein n=1 Tax=Elizabethkingia argenteiflava TaxID=2681556 RepID=A0A845PU34_9FLAO|nr:glycosyltransferase family 8 protein [Elizabethkingia argenteiflava]NAW51334.1 glycosyltransferase family 8 protein [Elizabethkingia argenteiflava]
MISRSTPIVLAFTPNYFIPAATCLYSILKHSPEEENFHIICLLTEELPQAMKDKFLHLTRNRVRYSFINLTGKLQDIYVDERYTIAASYRLLLPELLYEYDKVMYIDCDVVVRNDLAELYHKTDLGENYLAAVFEATLDFQIPYLQSIGCTPGEYINSGFLIINLDQMRKDHMVPKLLEAAKASHLQFPDQDVLNQLCVGKIIALPPYYNSIRTFFLPQYKTAFLNRYSEEDLQRVFRHGTIHYTGAKPWDTFTIKFDTWWSYYEELPLEIRQESKVNKKIWILYRFYKTSMGYFLISLLRNIYRYRFFSVKTLSSKPQ